MIERIDAHHHFWRYSKEGYDWIGPGMEALARDFLVNDLESEIKPCGINGTIVVQAQQTVNETEWLLDVAKDSPLIRGVVGWAPLCDRGLGAVLERWSAHKKLKGLRHVVQAEPDGQFILRDDFNAGVSALRGTGLIYDILIYERHLPATIAFVDRHPNQVFVLDHIAKPRIKDQLVEPWRSNIVELARRENVYCKISGVVTEADWQSWTGVGLQPYIDVVLSAFGPKRLMFGSDWPVCILAASYKKWFATLGELLTRFSQNEQSLIFGEVARMVYSC